MTGLEHAILGLQQALDAPRRHHVWRWLVRHRMAGVKDALAAEGMRDDDAWLAARELNLQRERTSLLRRLSELGPRSPTSSASGPTCSGSSPTWSGTASASTTWSTTP